MSLYGVSLEELKVAFLEAFRDIAAQQEADEKTKGLLRTLSETSAVPHCEHLPGIPIERDSSHIDRSKDALSRGKVQYKTIGGIGSHGHVWGHATFLVRSLLGVRTHPRRAGFLQSSESKYVLIDSETDGRFARVRRGRKTNQQHSLDNHAKEEIAHDQRRLPIKGLGDESRHFGLACFDLRAALRLSDDENRSDQVMQSEDFAFKDYGVGRVWCRVGANKIRARPGARSIHLRAFLRSNARPGPTDDLAHDEPARWVCLTRHLG